MSGLKAQLIKLGNQHKELRPHIRPILADLKEAAGRWEDMNGRTFDVGSRVEYWRDGARVWRGTVVGFENGKALVGDSNGVRPTKVDPQEARQHLRVASAKKARLGDGPVGEVLENYWNTIHDLEYDLKEAMKAYDMAASYVEGEGKKEAETVIKAVEKAQKELEKLSRKVFNDLFEAEEKFTKQHGHPEKYMDRIRRNMFRH